MSSQASPEKQLASTIASLHDSGAYSDLKIVCGQDTYNVHKAIICPQSEFFRAACRQDTFQEGKTGIIVIPATAGRDAAFFDKPINVEEFDWDLDVETNTAVKLMIHYFYHHDFIKKEGLSEHEAQSLSTENLTQGTLAEHARMYAMGEKYGVPGLKALAVAKFLAAIRGTNAGLTAAIMIAYSATPESDQVLRTVIIEILYHLCKVFEDVDEIQQVISRLPDLLYGLYRKMLKEKT
ncbi:hypothetical protein D6C78_03087 [Aureobasidium pullulans]|uniref:BTB domain-containing protein n=1 Tax=Aureobasidium pullulans TaxID=5580 RepID=A0A4T0C4G1_AURPU|nr:hypothetical protein D6C78_03087 [Aureobasidium pullulans]